METDSETEIKEVAKKHDMDVALNQPVAVEGEVLDDAMLVTPQLSESNTLQAITMRMQAAHRKMVKNLQRNCFMQRPLRFVLVFTTCTFVYKVVVKGRKY